MASSNPFLEVNRLNAYYGTAHALFDVRLAVEESSLTALLGRNGAGKSSTARAIMGVSVRSTGEIRLCGRDVQRLPAFQRARLGIQLVPEDRRIYTDLSVRQNLELGRNAVGGRTPISVDDILGIFPTLKELLERRGNQLSGGEQQLVAIARAMVPRPQLLIMDEPSQGLAPVILGQVADAIRLLRREFGTTVLLTEQNVRFALGLADHVTVIDEGSVVFWGTRQELDAEPELQRRYLAI